ncbi:SRPBCC family protein [Streptomyces pactum]|uniref:SRPBCC family protein n=1 Tax=Streptomyces pactum TaxID=68249 RepID=A0ABS0NSC1_9ACTN|nr:SRPBCC family protein [Streptomyces pactum]MBH5338090.1 SRPBCC family protein [Streptomyces pactum]
MTVTRRTAIRSIDPAAPVIARAATTVYAPPAAVWALHTDIGAWADWQTDVSRAEFTGPLAPGATFRWHTHGLAITSTVHQVVPRERIVWGGPAHGIDGIHVWTFEETGGAVTVRTEESWSGAPAEADPVGLRQALQRSLETWLRLLKAEAERRWPDRPSAVTP